MTQNENEDSRQKKLLHYFEYCKNRNDDDEQIESKIKIKMLSHWKV